MKQQVDQKDVTRVDPMTFGTRERGCSVVGKFGPIVVLAYCGNLPGRIPAKRENSFIPWVPMMT